MIPVSQTPSNAPPQTYAPGTLREKGLRRGRAPILSTAQKTTQQRPVRTTARHGRSLALVAVFALATAACSSEEQGSEAHSSKAHLGIEAPGAQLFLCNDGSKVEVERLPDRLSLNFRPSPGASPERLNAEAEGMPFVGEAVSVTHSHQTLAVMRPGLPAQVCRPATAPVPTSERAPP